MAIWEVTGEITGWSANRKFAGSFSIGREGWGQSAMRLERGGARSKRHVIYSRLLCMGKKTPGTLGSKGSAVHFQYNFLGFYVSGWKLRAKEWLLR